VPKWDENGLKAAKTDKTSVPKILARRGVISVAKRQKVTTFHIAIVPPNARFYPIAA
jgi:hypothetical protein